MSVKLCSTCHRLDCEGYAVGPDLYGIRNQPKESILMPIVMPEREVAPNFAAYDCITTDGRAIIGIMTADTADRVAPGVGNRGDRSAREHQAPHGQRVLADVAQPGAGDDPAKLADLLAYLRGER